MPIRASIDVGGTFTDFCAVDERTGLYTFVKDSTTPSNYAEGVINVIRKSKIPGKKLDRFIGTGSINFDRKFFDPEEKSNKK